MDHYEGPEILRIVMEEGRVIAVCNAKDCPHFFLLGRNYAEEFGQAIAHAILSHKLEEMEQHATVPF